MCLAWEVSYFIGQNQDEIDKLRLDVQEVIFTRPIRLLVRNRDNDASDDRSNSNDDKCLKCFDSPAEKMLSTLPTVSRSPKKVKKVKKEASPPSPSKGKGHQTEDTDTPFPLHDFIPFTLLYSPCPCVHQNT